MKAIKIQNVSLFSFVGFLGSGLMVLLGLSFVSVRALFGLGGGFAGDVLSLMGPGVAHADYSSSSGGSSGGGGCDGGACTPGFACGLSGSSGGGGGTGSGTGSCGGSC